MEEFSMITLLLRAVITLRHQSENLSMPTFHSMINNSKAADPSFEIPFATLDAFSAILTPNNGVIAASYLDKRQRASDNPFKDGDIIADPFTNPENHKNPIPLHIIVAVNPDEKTNDSSELPVIYLKGDDLWPEIEASHVDNLDPVGIIAGR